MPDSPLYRHQVMRSGAVCQIILTGELDLSNRDDVLAMLLTELSEPLTREVQVDLTGVEFADSTTLSALVFAYQAADEAGKAFVITATSPQVANVLRMTGLDEVLTDPDERSRDPGTPEPGNH